MYGRDETIAAARACARPGIVVREHGAGLGVAIVTRSAAVEAAAEALAVDIVLFDQRGCLSPRLVLVEGNADRGERFASALDEHLSAWGRRVPRGALFEAEIADAVVWREALAFAGRLWRGACHDVALAPPSGPLAIPPPGRCVHVLTARSLPDVAAKSRPSLASSSPLARTIRERSRAWRRPAREFLSWDACSVLPWTVRSIAAHFRRRLGPGSSVRSAIQRTGRSRFASHALCAPIGLISYVASRAVLFGIICTRRWGSSPHALGADALDFAQGHVNDPPLARAHRVERDHFALGGHPLGQAPRHLRQSGPRVALGNPLHPR